MSEETTEVNVTTKPVRGPSGRTGVTTASLALKQKWHEKHFKRVDTSDNAHPHRKNFKAERNAPSLKSFVRGLAMDGDEPAKMWLAAKCGEFEQRRAEHNVNKSADIARNRGKKKDK